MRKIAEFFSLLWLNLAVSLRNLAEWIKIAWRYYPNHAFLKEDLSLRLLYFFQSPFKISKRFLIARGEKEIYAYGETPLTSLEIIAKQAKIGPNDCVYELGSGRGFVCFWLNSFTGCSVVGIEQVPAFVQRAEKVRRRFDLKKIEFRQSDFCEADLTGATVIYLYGTCLHERSIQRLIQSFEKMPRGTKIITVSYSLAEFTPNPRFLLMKRFSVPFTWGDADVFLHIMDIMD
jgi:precorrin-6B methylase 2